MTHDDVKDIEAIMKELHGNPRLHVAGFPGQSGEEEWVVREDCTGAVLKFTKRGLLKVLREVESLPAESMPSLATEGTMSIRGLVAEYLLNQES